MTTATSITLPDLNMHAAEVRLVEEALRRSTTMYAAAELLDITRHALKRRTIKHDIPWRALLGKGRREAGAG